ncbi:MAG: hypothetical protein Q7R52_02975 [archaeon]|nr:hypothetical protein [archaeon]
MIINFGSDREELLAEELGKLFLSSVNNLDYGGNFPDDMILIGVYDGERSNSNINLLVGNGNFQSPDVGGVFQEAVVNGRNVKVLFGDTHENLAGAVIQVIKNQGFPAGGIEDLPIVGLEYIEFETGISADRVQDLQNNLAQIFIDTNNFLNQGGYNASVEHYVQRGQTLGIYVSGTPALILYIIIAFIVFLITAIIGVSTVATVKIFKDMFKDKQENDLAKLNLQKEHNQTQLDAVDSYLEGCAAGRIPANLCDQETADKIIEKIFGMKLELDKEESIFDKAGKFLLYAGVGIIAFIIVKDYVIPYLGSRKEKNKEKKKNG